MNVDSIYQFMEALGYTHPLHPTITHLTIGLVMAAFIFYLIGLLLQQKKYASTAKHCGTLAFLSVFPTVMLGLMDWTHYYGANWIFPISIKIILACILALLLLLSIILHVKTANRATGLLLVYLLSFFTVVGLGYFGGEIVFGQRSIKGDGTQTEVERTAPEGSKSSRVDFADVQTIFRNNCTNCHSGSNPPKNLGLKSYQKLVQGNENTPVVVPGKPGTSELIKRVKGLSTPKMPLSGPALSENDIQTLEKWVRAGAPGPES